MREFVIQEASIKKDYFRFISIPTRFNNQVKVSIEEGNILNRWVVKFEVLIIEQASH